MKLIALDQSSTATGISVFIDGSLVDYALIKPKASKKVGKITVQQSDHLYEILMPEEMYDTTLLRISAIVDVLDGIFDQEEPDVCYFEEIYQCRNVSGFRSLARLQGFIAHLCHSYDIRYRIVEESKWINHHGTYDSKVKRDERKADIMKKMNEKYGLTITVDDISDSIALGDYAVAQEEKENKNG